MKKVIFFVVVIFLGYGELKDFCANVVGGAIVNQQNQIEKAGV